MVGDAGSEPGQGVVDRVLYGDSKASVSCALQLRDLLGVPVEAWVQKATRAFRAPAKHSVRRVCKNAKTVARSAGCSNVRPVEVP